MKKYIHPKKFSVTVVLSSGESYKTYSCMDKQFAYSHLDNRNHEFWINSDTITTNKNLKNNNFKFFDNILND